MIAIPELMSSIRYCQSCDTKQVVNYWIHSGIRKQTGKKVVRYQCSKCSCQTTDLTVMDMTEDEYVETMAHYLGMSTDEYVSKHGGPIHDR